MLAILRHWKRTAELKVRTDELEKMKVELNTLKQTTVSKDEFEKLKAEIYSPIEFTGQY